jgi:hypothetical protein
MPRKKAPPPPPPPPKPKPKQPHRHAVGSSIMDGNGYPTALSPELHERMLVELRVGDWPQMAAIRANVAPRSMLRWLHEGSGPYAVEPYKRFADAFILEEAKISGRLMKIIWDEMEGNGVPTERGERPPNAELAKWMLMTRFRFLWAIDKEGRQGGLSVAEAVERHLETIEVGRAEKARAILSQLPAEAKQAARREGFLL